MFVSEEEPNKLLSSKQMNMNQIKQFKPEHHVIYYQKMGYEFCCQQQDNVTRKSYFFKPLSI